MLISQWHLDGPSAGPPEANGPHDGPPHGPPKVHGPRGLCPPPLVSPESKFSLLTKKVGKSLKYILAKFELSMSSRFQNIAVQN